MGRSKPKELRGRNVRKNGKPMERGRGKRGNTRGCGTEQNNFM